MAASGPIDHLMYGRIAVVGLCTCFLSGALLSVLTSLIVVKMDDLGTVSFFVNAFLLGGFGVFVGLIVWLPLTVVWNMAVHKMTRRTSLLSVSVIVSMGMSFGLLVLTAALMLSWDGASFRQFLLVGLWILGTVAIAGVLTWFAFRRSSLEEPE